MARQRAKWILCHTAGDCWRVQGQLAEADTTPLGRFDEIVVGERPGDSWLHVEMMDDRSAFVQVADRAMWVHVPSKGAPRITMEEQRLWVKFVRCRKRPGGKRCVMVEGHGSTCCSGAMEGT